MPKFEVTITEFLTKSVEVDAENANNAFWKVCDEWRNGIHVLDSDNFCDVEFEVRPFEKINGELTIDYEKTVPRYDKKGLAFPPTAWRLETFDEDVKRMKREGLI